MNSLTRPDLTQECLAGSNWRPSSAIHACAVWWPGMDLSDNTWGESTSVPGSRKLGMNINQSCCPIRSDSIVNLCLECCLTDSTYAYAAVWVGGLEVWEFVALFLLIHSCLRHPSAVCLLWTLPLGWRKVWQSSGLTSWGSHVAEEQWLKVMENNDL